MFTFFSGIEWLSWWRPWVSPSSFLALSLSLYHSDRLLAKMSHFTLFAVFLAAEQKVEPVSFRQRSGPRHHCFDTWNTIWTIWTNSCNAFLQHRVIITLAAMAEEMFVTPIAFSSSKLCLKVISLPP